MTAVNPVDGPTFVTAYIDDLLVFSSSLTEHFDYLRLVLEKLREVGLKFNPAKCCFLRKEVEYLEHVITPTGLKPNAKLVTAVQDYAPPQNVKELKRLLGLASYYRQFIPQFAKDCSSVAPIDLQGCGGFLYAHNNPDKYLSHCVPNLLACLRSILLRV